MINRIHKDHINIMQLLKVIDNKAAMLRMDGDIDYQLLKSITDYLQNYADKYHHPMEDLIYAYYLKYRVVSDKVANRLADEHHQLSQLTKELDDMLNMILLDAIIPRDIIIDKLEAFVNKQKQHLTYEELSILPAIQASLTPDDWAHLSLQWKQKEYSDPLFGDSISDRFQSLSEYIKQS